MLPYNFIVIIMVLIIKHRNNNLKITFMSNTNNTQAQDILNLKKAVAFLLEHNMKRRLKDIADEHLAQLTVIREYLDAAQDADQRSTLDAELWKVAGQQLIAEEAVKKAFQTISDPLTV